MTLWLWAVTPTRLPRREQLDDDGGGGVGLARCRAGPGCRACSAVEPGGQVATSASARSSPGAHQRAARRVPRSAGGAPAQQVVHRLRRDLAPLPRRRVAGDRLLDGSSRSTYSFGMRHSRSGSVLLGPTLSSTRPRVLVHRDDLERESRCRRRSTRRRRRSLVSCAGSKRYSSPGDRLIARAGVSVRIEAARDSRRSSNRSSTVMSWRVEHPPPHRLLLAPVELDQPADQLVEPRPPPAPRSTPGPAPRPPAAPAQRLGRRARVRRSGCRRRCSSRQRIGQVLDPALALPVQQPAPEPPGGLAVHPVVVPDPVRIGDSSHRRDSPAVDPPLVLHHRAAGREHRPGPRRQVEALDLLERIARRPDHEALPHHRVQVHEDAVPEQVVHLGLPGGVLAHQPLERGRLVRGVVVDVERPGTAAAAAMTQSMNPSNAARSSARVVGPPVVELRGRPRPRSPRRTGTRARPRRRGSPPCRRRRRRRTGAAAAPGRGAAPPGTGGRGLPERLWRVRGSRAGAGPGRGAARRRDRRSGGTWRPASHAASAVSVAIPSSSSRRTWPAGDAGDPAQVVGRRRGAARRRRSQRPQLAVEPGVGHAAPGSSRPGSATKERLSWR